MFVANFAELFWSAVIYAVLTTLVAYYYKTNKPPVEMSGSADTKKFEDWTTDILNPSDWSKDPALCALACCCPAIRWADSMSMVSFFSFWAAFAAFLGMQLLNSLTSGVLFWVVLSVVCAFQRQKIRVKFGMESKDTKTVAMDYLCYCCCLPCVVAQEARHIDEAAKSGHAATKEVA